MDQIFREVGSAGARDYRVCTAPGIPGKLLDFWKFYENLILASTPGKLLEFIY